MSCHISFPKTSFAPIALAPLTPLATVLTVQNSPVLFGCRTGICGTCLVTVRGDCAPPTAAECEVLSILAPDCPQARLACQVQVTTDLALERLR